MRADRLLSLLMLLQTRGKLTARQLADELEVSERTIYRDIEALSIAGVPVYAERGPGGGCALLDSYRTTLTGLTADQVRMLFMLGIPAPLTDLGVTGELKAALLKLTAALPAAHQAEEQRVRQRVYLDPDRWPQDDDPVPYLHTVYRAIWENRKLVLSYRLFDARVEHLVAPYGLVAKGGIWRLVACRDEHLRVYRLSHDLGVHLTDQPFERLPDFDLIAFWRGWCALYERRRPVYRVTVRVSPEMLSYLPHCFGQGINDQIAGAPADPEGWRRLTLTFETFEAARGRILSLGRGVEVLGPLPLRRSVEDFARQIVGLYGGEGVE